MKKYILILLLFASGQVIAQTDTTAVKTIEGTVKEMLALISGPIDEPRDWEAFRGLFTPTSQMQMVNRNAPSGRQFRSMSVEEFIRNIGPLYARDGFEELQTGIKVQEFNGMANVFQSYTARNLKGTYEKTGINSYQLVYYQDRWWIASSTWADADEENPLPQKYLMKNRNKKVFKGK